MHIPTKAALIDKTYRATMARSMPTGLNKGSKKVNVRNPDIIAVRYPENKRGLL
jgi:hypothetical protein